MASQNTLARIVAGLLLLLALLPGLAACGLFGGDDAAETPEPTPTEPSAGGALAPAPATWPELEGWLVEAWNDDVNPAVVRAALRAAGWQRSYDDWAAADFDGDLKDDWALVLYPLDIPGAGLGTPANVWVVSQGRVAYTLFENLEGDAIGSLAPRFVKVLDLTGDELPELIIDKQECGAHTCFSNFRILSMVDGQLTNIVSPLAPGQVISLSYADAYFGDYQQDGLTDFFVHGGAIGSVGAGIVRTYTQVWSWDGTAVTQIDTILDPTNYIHHILYEANDLLLSGQLDEALLLYERTINDRSLISPFGADAALRDALYADISRFSAFRLILIDLLKGDAARAQGRLAWMQQNHPGAAATQGAALLVRDWQGAANLPGLCGAIDQAMAAFSDPTGLLDDAMGYAHPSLSGADYCPYQ